MNRLLFPTAFLLGAIAVTWMGLGFINSDALALTVTLVIGCVYTIGFIELVQFRQATASLASALSTVPAGSTGKPDSLDGWLAQLHPSLRNAVRLRIEGERVGLPAPAVTPYLVGLLIMLGLLGTFVGMVETLKGAVFALEGTTELQAIRAGLAAPIKGLSLAFGTSVAGVAASAMLGLASTLVRRDRMLQTRVLDSRISTAFRDFSLIHNRQETYKALQMQAQALPQVAEKLEALAGNLAQMGDKLGDKLLANQELFHQSVTAIYTDLATSVDSSLRASLAESGRQAGESIKPLVHDAMAAISTEAENTHRQLTQSMQDQLEKLTGHFSSTSQEVAGAWSSSLAAQQQANESLIAALGQQWLQASERMDELTSTLKAELSSLRDEEQRGAEAAVARLADLEAGVASHLATLGKELEEPMTRLIQTASETPKAAAEVIGHLRQEISNNIERDNGLLEERRHIMKELVALTGALEKASEGQREALENLVNSTSGMLQEVSDRFTGQVGSELSKISDVSGDFAASATEMSSLGDAFSLAVTLFNETNGKLIESLTRIEASMDKSTSRSDEQMAYYVAQAREIIDQSMLSQREIFEEVRQLSQQAEVVAAGAS